MALIRKIDHVERDIRGVQQEAVCEYDVYQDHSGRRYLQLVTLGSTKRKMRGNVSQTIQFDEQGALQLKRLIEQTFSTH